jgi:hypothetical protein
MSSNLFAAMVALALCGCVPAPAAGSHCSVRTGHDGQMIVTVTLTNYSQQEIVHVSVLADTKRVHARDANRLFEADTHLAPGETRTVDGRSTGTNWYDFKSRSGALNGCELEYTVFADGTSWSAPSPL